MGELRAEDVSYLQWLQLEYVWRVDQAETATIHELFTENGRLSVPSGSAEGRDEIIAWGRGRPGRKGQSMHVCSNHRFESTGPDTAKGSTYLVVVVPDQAKPSPTVLLAGLYHDEFKNIDGTWYFASRTLAVLGQA
jgi:hypothetical protein